jgi:PAS domain S-box-containing protein
MLTAGIVTLAARWRRAREIRALPDIELILARSLAAHLSVPAFLADADGRFVYFNEAAEMMTGKSMEESIDFSPEELLDILDPRTDDGRRVTPEEFPLPRAIHARVPAHLHAVSGRDGGLRYLVTALPLLDGDGFSSGALMFLYEDKR